METNGNVQSVKVGRISEELQSILGDEFEVLFSESGITLYNNIKEYILSKKEVYQLLQDTGVELRYCIIDENNQNVTQHSIKLVNKRNKQYTYTSYDKIERCYSNFETVQGILSYLEFMNKNAKMNHTFSIEVFTVPIQKYYTIVDQDGRVVDHRSISLIPADDGKTLVWQYCTFTSVLDGGFFYSSKKLAEKKIEGLNLIKMFAGFGELGFRIEELKDYSNAGHGIRRRYLSVAKGKKTESRKIFRDYMKKYY